MNDIIRENFDLMFDAFDMVPDVLFDVFFFSLGLLVLVKIIRFALNFVGINDVSSCIDWSLDEAEELCPVGDISKCPYGCKSYNSDFCEKFCMFMEDDYASN